MLFQKPIWWMIGGIKKLVWIRQSQKMSHKYQFILKTWKMRIFDPFFVDIICRNVTQITSCPASEKNSCLFSWKSRFNNISGQKEFLLHHRYHMSSIFRSVFFVCLRGHILPSKIIWSSSRFIIGRSGYQNETWDDQETMTLWRNRNTWNNDSKSHLWKNNRQSK